MLWVLNRTRREGELKRGARVAFIRRRRTIKICWNRGGTRRGTFLKWRRHPGRSAEARGPSGQRGRIRRTKTKEKEGRKELTERINRGELSEGGVDRDLETRYEKWRQEPSFVPEGEVLADVWRKMLGKERGNNRERGDGGGVV